MAFPMTQIKDLSSCLINMNKKLRNIFPYFSGQTKAGLILHMAYFGAKSSTKAILELIDKGH